MKVLEISNFFYKAKNNLVPLKSIFVTLIAV